MNSRRKPLGNQPGIELHCSRCGHSIPHNAKLDWEFCSYCGVRFSPDSASRARSTIRGKYRWSAILSGFFAVVTLLQAITVKDGRGGYALGFIVCFFVLLSIYQLVTR